MPSKAYVFIRKKLRTPDLCKNVVRTLNKGLTVGQGLHEQVHGEAGAGLVPGAGAGGDERSGL